MEYVNNKCLALLRPENLGRKIVIYENIDL
jgi:hypothetical protein